MKKKEEEGRRRRTKWRRRKKKEHEEDEEHEDEETNEEACDDLMLFSSFCVPCVSLHSRNISRGIAKTLGQVLRMGQVCPVFFLERLQRSGVIKLSILGPGTVP